MGVVMLAGLRLAGKVSVRLLTPILFGVKGRGHDQTN